MKFTQLAELKIEVKELRAHSLLMSDSMKKMKEREKEVDAGFRLAYRLYQSGNFKRAEECMSKALGI